MKQLIIFFTLLSFGVKAQNIMINGMIYAHQANTIQVSSSSVDLNTATFLLTHPNIMSFTVNKSTNFAQIFFSFSCNSGIEFNQMVRVDVNAPGGNAVQNIPIMLNYGFYMYNEIFPCATGPATGRASVKLINGPATYEVDYKGSVFTVSNDVEFILDSMQAYTNTLKVRPAGASCFNIYHLTNSPLEFNVQGSVATSTTAADCNGTAKRYINYNYSSTISYEWFDSNMVSINQFTEEAVNLCPGKYTVKHTHDYTGCSVMADVTVPEIITTSIDENKVTGLSLIKDISNNLNIYSENIRINEIEIIDVSGKLVKEMKVGSFDAYIPSDKSYRGFYIIIIKLEDGRAKHEKVIF